jgi:hypothetical protein
MRRVQSELRKVAVGENMVDSRHVSGIKLAEYCD